MRMRDVYTTANLKQHRPTVRTCSYSHHVTTE